MTTFCDLGTDSIARPRVPCSSNSRSKTRTHTHLWRLELTVVVGTPQELLSLLRMALFVILVVGARRKAFPAVLTCERFLSCNKNATHKKRVVYTFAVHH